MQFSSSNALSTIITIWPQSFLSVGAVFFLPFVVYKKCPGKGTQYRITRVLASAGEIRVGCRRAAVGDQCSLQQITISLTVNHGRWAVGNNNYWMDPAGYIRVCLSECLCTPDDIIFVCVCFAVEYVRIEGQTPHRTAAGDANLLVGPLLGHSRRPSEFGRLFASAGLCALEF